MGPRARERSKPTTFAKLDEILKCSCAPWLRFRFSVLSFSTVLLHLCFTAMFSACSCAPRCVCASTLYLSLQVCQPLVISSSVSAMIPRCAHTLVITQPNLQHSIGSAVQGYTYAAATHRTQTLVSCTVSASWSPTLPDSRCWIVCQERLGSALQLRLYKTSV